MFVRLLTMDHKHVPQAVAGAEMVSGAPVDGGAFIASVPKNYDGLNAVVDPKLADCAKIAEGDIYNKAPTFVGERYATTEIDNVAGLTAGNLLTVADGKWKKATNGTAEWKYGGEFTGHDYGVKLYIVEKVPETEVSQAS